MRTPSARDDNDGPRVMDTLKENPQYSIKENLQNSVGNPKDYVNDIYGCIKVKDLY